MKKLALLIAIGFSTIAFAQETRDVGQFTKVNVYDKIDLTLVKSNEHKIELEGTNVGSVLVVNKNGNLKIKMDLTNSLQGGDVKATLYYNTLEEIIGEEGAKVTSKETIKSSVLAISTKTGANVKLNVDTDKLNIKAYTGGVLALTGKANVQDILANAGGAVENAKLVTNQTTVTVNAGGSADVQAKDLVDAKTRAGGEIRIFGKPKVVNQKTIAGGSIKVIAN